MKGKQKTIRVDETGSALVYILIAIALLAALTVAFMNPSSNQTTSQNTFKTTSEMQTQADFIRSAIQECVLTYPGGDAGVITAHPGYSHNYPLIPDDGYFGTCAANLPEPAGTQLVSELRCPGNPGDDPNHCHSDIFGGAGGKFLPPQPALFGPWKYYNGIDGVFIWLATTNTDAYIDTVLDKLDDGYSECEADVMKPNAGDFQMTSDMGANVVCPDESKCFRLWLKINGTAVYTNPSAEFTAGCP